MSEGAWANQYFFGLNFSVELFRMLIPHLGPFSCTESFYFSRSAHLSHPRWTQETGSQ